MAQFVDEEFFIKLFAKEKLNVTMPVTWTGKKLKEWKGIECQKISNKLWEYVNMHREELNYADNLTEKLTSRNVRRWFGKTKKDGIPNKIYLLLEEIINGGVKQLTVVDFPMEISDKRKENSIIPTLVNKRSENHLDKNVNIGQHTNGSSILVDIKTYLKSRQSIWDTETITNLYFPNIILHETITSTLVSHDKILILGKSGSGKSTLITHLGNNWSKSNKKVFVLSLSRLPAIDNLEIRNILAAHNQKNSVLLIDDCHNNAYATLTILNLLPQFPNVKIVFVSRDVKDIYAKDVPFPFSYLDAFSKEETIYLKPVALDINGIISKYLDHYDKTISVPDEAQLINVVCGENLKLLRLLLEIWRKDHFTGSILALDETILLENLWVEYFKDSNAEETMTILKIALLSQYDLPCIDFKSWLSIKKKEFSKAGILEEDQLRGKDWVLATYKFNHATIGKYIFEAAHAHGLLQQGKADFECETIENYLHLFSQTPYLNLFKEFFRVFEHLQMNSAQILPRLLQSKVVQEVCQRIAKEEISEASNVVLTSYFLKFYSLVSNHTQNMPEVLVTYQEFWLHKKERSDDLIRFVNTEIHSSVEILQAIRLLLASKEYQNINFKNVFEKLKGPNAVHSVEHVVTLHTLIFSSSLSPNEQSHLWDLFLDNANIIELGKEHQHQHIGNILTSINSIYRTGNRTLRLFMKGLGYDTLGTKAQAGLFYARGNAKKVPRYYFTLSILRKVATSSDVEHFVRAFTFPHLLTLIQNFVSAEVVYVIEEFLLLRYSSKELKMKGFDFEQLIAKRFLSMRFVQVNLQYGYPYQTKMLQDDIRGLQRRFNAMDEEQIVIKQITSLTQLNGIIYNEYKFGIPVLGAILTEYLRTNTQPNSERKELEKLFLNAELKEISLFLSYFANGVNHCLSFPIPWSLMAHEGFLEEKYHTASNSEISFFFAHLMNYYPANIDYKDFVCQTIHNFLMDRVLLDKYLETSDFTQFAMFFDLLIRIHPQEIMTIVTRHDFRNLLVTKMEMAPNNLESQKVSLQLIGVFILLKIPIPPTLAQRIIKTLVLKHLHKVDSDLLEGKLIPYCVIAGLSSLPNVRIEEKYLNKAIERVSHFFCSPKYIAQYVQYFNTQKLQLV